MVLNLLEKLQKNNLIALKQKRHLLIFVMKTTTPKIKTYKGFPIATLFPYGYYEVYLGGKFMKADTLRGVKNLINLFLKNK